MLYAIGIADSVWIGKNQMKQFIPLFLILGTMSGCATMTTGSRQDVLFTSEPAGADVVISSRNQKKTFRTTTPGTVSLKRRDQYDALFSKAGYHEVTKPVDHNLWRNTADFGNWLLTVSPWMHETFVAQHEFEEEIHAQLTLLGEDTVLPAEQVLFEALEAEPTENDTDTSAKEEPAERDEVTVAKAETVSKQESNPPDTTNLKLDEDTVLPAGQVLLETIDVEPTESDTNASAKEESSENDEVNVEEVETNENDEVNVTEVETSENDEVTVAKAVTLSTQESTPPVTTHLILEYSVHSQNIPPVNVRVDKEKFIQLGKGEHHTAELTPGIHTIKIKDPFKANPRKPNWRIYELKINTENGKTTRVTMMTHRSGGETAVTLYVVQDGRIVKEVNIPAI